MLKDEGKGSATASFLDISICKFTHLPLILNACLLEFVNLRINKNFGVSWHVGKIALQYKARRKDSLVDNYDSYGIYSSYN